MPSAMYQLSRVREVGQGRSMEDLSLKLAFSLSSSSLSSLLLLLALASTRYFLVIAAAVTGGEL